MSLCIDIRNPNRTLIKPEMVNMNIKWKRPAFGDGIPAGILDIRKSFELARIFQPWYEFLAANCEFTSKYFNWLVSLGVEQKQTDERTPTSRFCRYLYAKLIKLERFLHFNIREDKCWNSIHKRSRAFNFTVKLDRYLRFMSFAAQHIITRRYFRYRSFNYETGAFCVNVIRIPFKINLSSELINLFYLFNYVNRK